MNPNPQDEMRILWEERRKIRGAFYTYLSTINDEKYSEHSLSVFRLKMAEPRVRKASRKINEAEYGMFQAKNALRSENLKEIKRNKSESDSIIISLNKSPDAGASKDKALRNEELRRLQLEKKVLMGTGGIVQYSAAINQIDKKIARLSQE